METLEMTRAATAALAVEIAFTLAGLVCLWHFAIRPAARRAPLRLPAWNLLVSDFLLYLLLSIIGALAFGSAAGVLLRGSRFDSDDQLLLSSAAMHGGILAGILLFHFGFHPERRGRRQPWEAPCAPDFDPSPPAASPAAAGLARAAENGASPASDGNRWDRSKAAVRGALLSGGVTFLAALPIVFAASKLWELALIRLGLPPADQQLIDILEKTHSNFTRATLVIMATLLVPFTEELIFRAGLFRYLRTRISRWPAIVLTAVLFGALHVDWSTLDGLASLLPLTMLAIVFSLAYERTATIGTTIVAHALFNLFIFILVVAGVDS